MDDVYPRGPAAVPQNFTQATSSYRVHAWLALAGLAAFVLLYFALAGWFTWTAWRLLAGAIDGGENALWGFVAGLSAAFLAVFMLKALFFVKHSYEIDDLEITPQDQPKLFEFLRRLADDAGAPRAHRVFLSPRVNAAVFYDLSILNLVFPTKKNLEIGLPLVNVLTLGELKAVLAHEFGHFAQRSMAVGRWVYIGQQIAAQIIGRRDALDKFLRGLSSTDVRIAWVGWILSLTVWSIRALTETVFRLVLLAQRALSREMEFQADLVSVSLTGSDALIHALHKLAAAEQSWDRAVGFASTEAGAGRGVTDLFALQSLVTDRIRGILGDPSYGKPAPVPKERPDTHRLFATAIAQAPRMWATHPSNNEREENAKRTYISAPLDDRSAWELFDGAAALRERMSSHVFRNAKTELVPLEESQQRLEADYDRPYLDRRYRGAYLGRAVTLHAATVAELYEAKAEDSRVGNLDSLYPEPLGVELKRLRDMQDERAALQALRDGFLQAPGGIIRHRGRELRRRDLPKAIEKVDEEVKEAEAGVRAHDRRCRSAHLQVAQTLGAGWPEYLAGLLAALHYAEHAEADVRDAHGAFANVFSIVTADNRVSASELKRLLAAGVELHAALERVFVQASAIRLDRTLLNRLSVDQWSAALEEFKLQPPSEANVSAWVGAIDGWVGSATASLSKLRFAVLDQLLLAERQVAKLAHAKLQPTAAPEPSLMPPSYAVLVPGKERARQKRLGLWDRFQTADGAWATAARLAVAGGIVAAVVGVGGLIDDTKLDIYNGLDRAVHVDVAGNGLTVGPFSSARMALAGVSNPTISTTFVDGRPIETFEAETTRSFAHFVYNVASAGVLLEWTQTYGSARAVPERSIGAVRWISTTADHVFEQPPETISTSGSGGTRRVLEAIDSSPTVLAQWTNSDEERARLITAHARWDGPDGKRLEDWLALASEQPNFAELVLQRLADNPRDIMTLRIEQHFTTGAEHEAVCARQTALAAAEPDVGDLSYLAARCVADEAQQRRAFRAAFERHPDNGWLAFAVGSDNAAEGRWADAVEPLELALTIPGLGESVGLTLGRVCRMTTACADVAWTTVLEGSSALRFFAEVEGNNELPPDYMAYRDLARGDLDAALQKVGDSPLGPDMLVLAAASDGASSELVARAMALQPDDVGQSAQFAMLGLALRERRTIDLANGYSAVAALPASDRDSLSRFVSALEARDLAAADRALERASVALRAYAYSMGAVAAGKGAPERWRDGASKLLFVPERPYFTSTDDSGRRTSL
jgi:Zn-dependent protease with chaperone function